MRSPGGLARIGAAMGVGGAALVLVATFLPWFTVDADAFGGSSFSNSVSGLDDGSAGTVVIVLGLLAGSLALGRLLAGGPALLGLGLVLSGLVVSLVGLVERGDEDAAAADQGLGALGSVSPDIGLWLVILGGLVVAAGGALVLQEAGRRPTT